MIERNKKHVWQKMYCESINNLTFCNWNLVKSAIFTFKICKQFTEKNYKLFDTKIFAKCSKSMWKFYKLQYVIKS